MAMVPEDDDPEERRRHPRAPVDFLVSLRFPSVQQFLSVYAGDISESGMFIRGWVTDKEGMPRQVGQVVSLRFDAGHERIVEGTARIVRIVPDGPNPGIGVQFEELDATGRKLIEMIIRIQLAAG
jgi:hypothetical protein